VAPGQILEVAASLLHEGSGYAVVKASIAVGGKKVTEAEIRYGVVAFPNATLQAAMLETARRIGLPAQFMPAQFMPGEGSPVGVLPAGLAGGPDGA
jgi:3-hydroxyacyl-[acyl-carrier-protein] dehydratase